MGDPRRIILLESSIALLVFALLLYFMIPPFLSVQRYGPIDPMKCLSARGTWTWNKDTLLQSSHDQQALLTFTPVIENGVLSCKACVEEGKEGVQLVFGYRNQTEFCVWNLGGNGNTMTRLEYWFTPGNPNRLPINEIMPSVLFNGVDYTEWVPPQPFHLTHGEWHDIRLVLNSTSCCVEGFVDGQSILRHTLPAKIQGRMGLCTWWTVAKFKDIRISPAPKP